jgi:hypothetical protein
MDWTYGKILEQMKEFRAFLVSIGVTPDMDRIGAHIETIEKLEAARESGNVDQIDDEQTLWSMTEAIELIEIHRNLRDYDARTLSQKLNLILKGPGVPLEEDSDSNLARNTTFELSLAAKLQRAGVFKGLLENPDIFCKVDELAVLVQCKRPLEEKTIKRNIERATMQLRRDLQIRGNESAVGVIAISLSRVLSPRLGLLESSHTDNVRDVVRQRVDDLAQRYQSVIPVDHNIIGTVFDVSMPVFTNAPDRPHGRLGSVHIQCVYRHHPESVRDIQVLQRMFDRRET